MNTKKNTKLRFQVSTLHQSELRMANSCEFRDPFIVVIWPSSTHLLLKVLRLLMKQDHAHTKVASFHRRKGFVCDFMSPALAFALRKAYRSKRQFRYVFVVII